MTSKKKPKKTTTSSRRTARQKKAPKKRKVKRVKTAKATKATKAEAKTTNGSNGHVGWTASRIVALRNKLRLTQEQFSQKLGVTYVSVNRWENGKVLPKGLSLRALEQLEATA